ncbi:hypothetical protein TCON_2734, partial [Astathelohania contejeani]
LSSYIFTNKGIFLKKNFKDNNNIKQIVPIFNEDKRRINRRKIYIPVINLYKSYLFLFSVAIIENSHFIKSSNNVINQDEVMKYHLNMMALKLILRTKLELENLFVLEEFVLFKDEQLKKIRDMDLIKSVISRCHLTCWIYLNNIYNFNESKHFLLLSEYYSNYFFNMRKFVLNNLKTYIVEINLDNNENIFMESVRKFNTVNIKINSYINIMDGTPASGLGVLSNWVTKISEHI